MSNPAEPDGNPSECEFAADSLTTPKNRLELLRIASWRCSRPVWDQADEQHCVWHADSEDKPVTELKENIGYGDLHGAVVPPNTDLTPVSFPAGAGLTDCNFSDAYISDPDDNADLSGVFLRDADLSGAFLSDADLSDASLPDADLSGAFLRDADLSDADLRDADLSEAVLIDANLSDADLRNADLSGADLAGAELPRADLRAADLFGASLFDAELTNITPYGARFEGVKISDGTDFHTNRSEYQRWWQHGPLSPPPRCGYDPKVDQPEQTADTNREELLTKAADTYRQFEEIARRNTQPSLQSCMFVLRQDMQRERYQEKGQYLQAFANRMFRIVFKHGESFARILLTAAMIILLFAGTYWQADLILENPGSDPSNYVFVDGFLDALYFSTLTFTTLGLGDFQPAPASQLGRALVLIEAVIGAVLIATFVFVLGRRAAR